MEERSGSFLPELLYTNRGVIRQKEELSALIDWCQITIKEVPLEAVIEDVLRIPLELMTVTGYEKGIAGHEVVAIFDNIKVLKPTGNAQYQGFQILMSGKGCRNYENFLQLNEETWFDFLNRVCQYHINVPRIDLAFFEFLAVFHLIPFQTGSVDIRSVGNAFEMDDLGFWLVNDAVARFPHLKCQIRIFAVRRGKPLVETADLLPECGG